MKFAATTMLVLAVALAAGCNTTPTQDGAVLGGALGAGLGAIVGNQSGGRTGEGALIGAGVGAIAGALVGDSVDEARQGRQMTPQAQAPAARRGHYETRIVETPGGERYEERVWIPEN